MLLACNDVILVLIAILDNDDVPNNTPKQYWNQSTILIHHFNDTGNRQQQIIDNLVGMELLTPGINYMMLTSLGNDFKGVYISTTGDYNSAGQPVDSGVYEYISALWTRFCNDMYSN